MLFRSISLMRANCSLTFSLKIGQDVLAARALTKNKQMVAPNGVIISMKPTWKEYVDNEVGTAGDFWKQAYVEHIVRDTQMGKLCRSLAAEKLGVTEAKLLHQINKLNNKEGVSDYERERQENIAERYAFFRQSNLEQLKKEVKQGKWTGYKARNAKCIQLR